MKKLQFITKELGFDYGHRVCKHGSRCYNPHGHRGSVEITYSFNEIDDDLGYAIDFGEIKRLCGTWIDDKIDHAFLSNPTDEATINYVMSLDAKLYLMSLNGAGYCNPSAENISKELFLTCDYLINDSNLVLHSIKFYETPSSFVTCYKDSINDEEEENFLLCRQEELENFMSKMGTLSYKQDE